MTSCASDVLMRGTLDMDRKGLIVDDVSMCYCPQKLPELWPNTVAPVRAIRLFRAWDTAWRGEDRTPHLNAIAYYAKENQVKVLVGTNVDSDDRDHADWNFAKKLLKRLGPEHVMGLAIGNNLDHFYLSRKKGDAQEIWDNGRLWSEFNRRIEEMDAMGFGGVPVTSVFSDSVLKGGYPFVDIPSKRLVNTFLHNATKKYGSRFVFSFNVDPFYESKLRMDPDSNGTCVNALQESLYLGKGCLAPTTMSTLRQRVQDLTGSRSNQIWIGSIGWQSKPPGKKERYPLRECEEFASNESLENFYREFLAWDLGLGDGVNGPDFVFYNSLRDSVSFRSMEKEHFGLISTCESQTCKIFSNIHEVQVSYGQNLWWLPFDFMGIFAVVILATMITVCYVKRANRKSGDYSDVEYNHEDLAYHES